MYALRHKPSQRWMQAQSSANKFGHAARLFPTLGGIKRSIDAYVTDNAWRMSYEGKTREELVAELEVCEVEFTPTAIIPAHEVLKLFEDDLERKKRHLTQRR
jgi:hypothetical protein